MSDRILRKNRLRPTNPEMPQRFMSCSESVTRRSVAVRRARFRFLPPGDFRFELRVSLR